MLVSRVTNDETEPKQTKHIKLPILFLKYAIYILYVKYVF